MYVRRRAENGTSRKLAPVSLVIGKDRLMWFGCVEEDDNDSDWVKHIVMMEVVGARQGTSEKGLVG